MTVFAAEWGGFSSLYGVFGLVLAVFTGYLGRFDSLYRDFGRLDSLYRDSDLVSTVFTGDWGGF